MSFRGRLTLFFLLIVVLPMVAVAVLVSVVADDSRTGKADARLGASTETALALYDEQLAEGRGDARAAGRDEALADALRAGDPAEARVAAARLRRDLGVASVSVLDGSGDELASVGDPDGIAQSEIELRGPEGPIGNVSVAPISARTYVDEVERLTDSDVAVLRDGRELASTLDLGEADVPEGSGAQDFEQAGDEYRVDTVAPGGADPGVRLAVFAPRESGGLAATPPLVAGALAAFFAVAVFFVVLLLRSLQGQTREMLNAARRVGGGDFSQKVPVEGDDEMAGMAREFNKMSGRLSDQMDALRRQLVELERSVQRIGEAFASGLDRTALLQVAADTALSGCAAETCRVILSGHRWVEAGAAPSGDLNRALEEAQAPAARQRDAVSTQSGDAHALAIPLAGMSKGPGNEPVIAVGRSGARFDSAQSDLLHYLAGQAAVSVENIELHELVSEQAIRDELTGLANPRRFRELIVKEAVRAERFGHQLSLLLLDIDDFKQVNDTHGHLQGDEVLRTVGRILQQESRGVDEPARYGGKEFAVALPETGREGALEVAARIRAAIVASPISLIVGSGEIEVTASLGVATSAPGSAPDAKSLIAAADAALYQAKRRGKNRTVCAPGAPRNVPTQGQPVERRT